MRRQMHLHNTCCPPPPCSMQANSDIRGVEKLLDVPATPAEFPCFKCWQQGHYLGHKMVYGQHQCHLPLGHKLRGVLSSLNMPTNSAPRDPNTTLVPAPRTTEQLRAGKFAAWLCGSRSAVHTTGEAAGTVCSCVSGTFCSCGGTPEPMTACVLCSCLWLCGLL